MVGLRFAACLFGGCSGFRGRLGAGTGSVVRAGKVWVEVR
jgi:hypothetical protein